MIEVTVSEVREQLAHLLGKVQHGGEVVEISRHGKAVAYVVSAAEWAFLQDCEDLHWGRELDRTRAEPGYDPKDTMPAKEFFAQLHVEDAAKDAAE